jgi:hypothetical protein
MVVAVFQVPLSVQPKGGGRPTWRPTSPLACCAERDVGYAILAGLD